MRKIFLSYASESQSQVHGLAEDLSRKGNEVWLDRYRLGPTEADWSETIYKSIGNCDHFILFSSPAALKSKWVRFECAAAVARDISRSIVKLKSCEPIHENFGYWWNERFQNCCCDLRTGQTYSDEWKRFLSFFSASVKLKKGMPQLRIKRGDWISTWTRYRFFGGDVAYENYKKDPGQVFDLDQLEEILNFFKNLETDTNQAADYAIFFLKKYSYKSLERYRIWYNFASKPETHLSRNILMDTAIHFAMRMVTIDPGPVVSMFTLFKQKGWDHDVAWLHALSASYGAIYEEMEF